MREIIPNIWKFAFLAESKFDGPGMLTCTACVGAVAGEEEQVGMNEA